MPRAKRPKKNGRPEKIPDNEATRKTLEDLGKIQATDYECAAFLGVHKVTFCRWKKRHPGAADALEFSRTDGVISLRRTQFHLAKTNAQVAIHLGKVYLGQSEKQEHQHTGPGGGPIQTVDLSKVSDADLKRLETILGGTSEPRGDQSGEGEAGS